MASVRRGVAALVGAVLAAGVGQRPLAAAPTLSAMEMLNLAQRAEGAATFRRAPRNATSPSARSTRCSRSASMRCQYAESNRAHKKMMALSALCRRRGDPVEARRAIDRRRFVEASRDPREARLDALVDFVQ